MLWTKGVEWVKVLDALSPLCLWQCFLLLQSQFSIFWSGSHSTMVAAAAVLNSSPTVGRDGGNILWALCCIFGQFPSAQPSLSLANIFDCSHHCHHPKFYHPPLTRKGRCGRDRFLNCCKRHKNSQQKPILDRMQGCCPVLQTFPRKILTVPPHADLAKVLNSFSFFKWIVPMMIIDRQKKVKRFGVHSFSRIAK